MVLPSFTIKLAQKHVFGSAKIPSRNDSDYPGSSHYFRRFLWFFLAAYSQKDPGDVRTHVACSYEGTIIDGQTAKSNGVKWKRNSANARNKKDFFKVSVDRRNTLR